MRVICHVIVTRLTGGLAWAEPRKKFRNPDVVGGDRTAEVWQGGLRSGAAVCQDAKLVALWVGKYYPAHMALADVGASST
jgi:hypothetical protein